MNNFLDNGTVLPFGLLGDNAHAMMGAFNKTYNNSYLRVGVVVKSYDIFDTNNRSKLTTEYDVSVIEQNGDIGATTIRYKNCMAVDSFGSIPDFFEKTFRIMQKKTTKGSGIDLSGQNGAIVLLLCLDGMSDKGLIIGGFPHPDRATNLIDNGPRLEGEFNGVNLKVNPDGSTGIMFSGPTNNDGDSISSVGSTNINIETDGSFQINHSTVTFRLDKSGEVTITAKGDVNVNCDNATVTATGNATIEGTNVNLGAGASEAVIKGDTFAQIFNNHVHLGNLGASVSPPLQPMNSALSKKIKTE